MLCVAYHVFSDTGDYLRRLEKRENDKEEHEKNDERRRRQSISTVRTDEDEADPVASDGAAVQIAIDQIDRSCDIAVIEMGQCSLDLLNLTDDCRDVEIGELVEPARQKLQRPVNRRHIEPTELLLRLFQR